MIGRGNKVVGVHIVWDCYMECGIDSLHLVSHLVIVGVDVETEADLV